MFISKTCSATVQKVFFFAFSFNAFCIDIYLVGVFDKNVDTVASNHYGKLLNFVNKIFSPNLQDLIIHIIFSHLISFEIVQMRLILCFQTVYDPFFISAYNVFFTSMPIIVVGVFDKDVDTVASIRYGKLYSPGVSSQFFNRKLFFKLKHPHFS